MLGRLVKQFVKRGARDHLGGARRVQEETDLHRLFVLTSFHRADGDGVELVEKVTERGKTLSFDHLKAEVTNNLTEQSYSKFNAVRDALAAARLANRSSISHSDALANGVLDRLGFTCRVAPSTAGPTSGDGLFVRGEVNPGEIVAFYPGLVYDIENMRHIPGYPKVAEDNEYLIARYDGIVIDAKPWGTGGGLVAVDTEANVLKRGQQDDTDAIDSNDPSSDSSFNSSSQSFGDWPGPPLLEEKLEEKQKQSPRAGVGGFLDDTLTPPLDLDVKNLAASDADAVARNNPFALAHFANHPPFGFRPNVVVAGVDLVFDDSNELRQFAPNVSIGAFSQPLTLEQIEKRKADSAKKGWFASKLHLMFGEEEDDESDGTSSSEKKKKVVVPALVLVASEALQDEEVFLNYRLSTHVPAPEWYHPVDVEEDKRRWASE